MPLQKASARMAESVDALVSNTSRFTPVPVRPRLRVQNKVGNHLIINLISFVGCNIGVTSRQLRPKSRPYTQKTAVVIHPLGGGG